MYLQNTNWFILVLLLLSIFDSVFSQSGCKGLENGKYYLREDDGFYLSRCEKCAPISNKGSDHSVAVNGWYGDTKAQWTFEPVGDKCAIKSDIGLYMSRCAQCWHEASFTDFVFLQGKDLWDVEVHDGLYVFKSYAGYYLSKCQNCVRNTKDVNTFSNFAYDNKPPKSAQWMAVPVVPYAGFTIPDFARYDHQPKLVERNS